MILQYLVSLLKSTDFECLMNAAGTIGTIVCDFKINQIIHQNLIYF